MGAVRHFLRVDPESLERKDEEDLWRRSLGAEVGSYSTQQITLSTSLVCFRQAVTLGKESVPIGRLGPKADFHFATLDLCNMNQVPDCRQSCAVALRVFLLPDGV